MSNHDQTTKTTPTADEEGPPKCFLHGNGCKNEGSPPLMLVTIDGEQHPIHGVPREKGLKSCVQVLEENILAKDKDGLPVLRDEQGNPLYTLGHGGNVRFDVSDDLRAIRKTNRAKLHEKELAKEARGQELGALSFLKARVVKEGPTAMAAAMETAQAKKEATSSEPVQKDWLGRPITD